MAADEQPDADEATRDAIAALTHRVRARDAEKESADASVFATEYVIALRGQGWRPTHAKPMKPWKAAVSGRPASEEMKAAFRSELEQQPWYRKAHPELDGDDAA